mmetsp:Transcript_21141/g.51988  ORF Transcript_21141/g.51988 Transcript_21141/m.51988 type:complete len:329 (+) Transcript_21141:26-1012(+)
MNHLSKSTSTRTSTRVGGVDTSSEEEMMQPPPKMPSVVDTYQNEWDNAIKYNSVSTDAESDDEVSISDVKDLFHKARLLLCPTKFYRQITYLYAERKLMVFFLVHLVSTLIIWCKSFLLFLSIIAADETLSLINSLSSPFCTAQAGCSAHQRPRNCQSILVEDHCSTSRVWIHARHSLSNGFDSVDHGPILHCKSMRLFPQQYLATEQSTSHAHSSWIHNDLHCLLGCHFLLHFLRIALLGRRRSLLREIHRRDHDHWILHLGILALGWFHILLSPFHPLRDLLRNPSCGLHHVLCDHCSHLGRGSAYWKGTEPNLQVVHFDPALLLL